MNQTDWEREHHLSIACSVYKGYANKNPDLTKRRTYKMTLERDYKSRDYLYGRLLALAESIEHRALKLSGENRITNAERLMQRFSSRPFSTWKIIDESLRPYRDRLKISKDGGLLHYWEREIEEVANLFDHTSFSNDKPLSGEYLLGYYCQKHYKKNEDNHLENEDHESTE